MEMRFGKLLRLLILAGLLALNWASAPPSATTAAPPPAEDIPADWWSQVQEDVRQSEYHITRQEHSYLPDLDAAYQAPNRAQNLRFYFTPEGVRVIPRTGDATWELGLSVDDAGPAELAAQERSLVYRRAALGETFTNTDAGLRHEIALGDATTFDLALSGDLTPHIAADGASVEFLTASGVPVLRYGDFSTPVRLSLPDAHHLRLTLPISNLPSPNFQFHALLTALPHTADWSAESNQADAHLGFAVAGAGDVNGDGYSDVIVGAPDFDGGQTNEGRVYGYYGAAAGLGATASWTKEINQAGAQFGAAVASAGDVNGDGYADVIIGAPNYANGQAQEGAAFVYHGSASGLSATANWSAESDKAGAHFGAAVSSTGYAHSSEYTGVLVGAPEYNNGQANEGMAFIYYGSGSGLSVAPNWSAESDLATARFGAAVGCAGDVDGNGYADVIIGAPGYDNGETDEGRAFVYYGAAGSISATANWFVESNRAGANLGASVSLAGDVNGDGYGDVIVGAPGYANGNTAEGAAFVYLGASTGLTTTVGWSVEGGADNARLGAAVALAGDVDGDGYADVIVGVPGYANGETGEGTAYLYSGSAAGLGATSTWNPQLNQAGAQFGAAVAGAGDVNGDGFSDVIVGAPGYSHSESNEGGAFVFYGHADPPNTTHDWTATRSQNTERFGVVVNSAGDVNGDGYADVIVGAPLFDGGQTDEGRALVYLGSANGLSTSPIWSQENNRAYANFGAAVSTAGDADGDGYDDVIIGAPEDSQGQSSEGFIYVYFGKASGLETASPWFAEGNQQFSRLGIAVDCAGDVNGDGYSDIIVGASEYTLGEAHEGAAFIWLGSTDVAKGGAQGFPSNAYWTGQANQASASFGRAVSAAGDVNGDGFSDVLVGAHAYDNGETDEGAAFLFLGGAGTMNADFVWRAEGNMAGVVYGTSVSTAGDVNGDGYSDFIVGAPRYANGENTEGRSYLYYGTSGTINPEPDLTLEINEIGALFGTSVSTAGDVNGDGYADVIVGAPGYASTNGGAFIFYGAATGLNTVPNWNQSFNVTGAKFGVAVSAAGDVNGDGFDDVIIGTDSSTAVYAYYGNGGGMALLPRQLQPGGATRLAPLGRADSEDSVQVRLEGKTPLGRDPLKLEWQVAPLGQDFGGSGTVSGVYAGWRAPGSTFTQTVAGLASSTAYHWRVRLRYRTGNPLHMPASRWIHMPWNGWLETDFQTAPGALTVTATNDSPTALGSTTTLTATSDSTYVAYTWNFGDSATGSGKVVTHTYAAAGTYMATVTASNGVSTVVASTPVIVGDEPIAGLALVNSSPTVAGQTTSFTATVTAGGGITYTWNFGDGSPPVGSGTANTVQHVYTTPGNYVATVTARNFYGPVNATSPVIITNAPVAGLTAANDSPTPLGQPTHLTATITSGGGVSYAWNFGDGTTGSGATIAHTYGAVGSFTAIVTASNNVNSLTTTTEVTIADLPVAGLSAVNDSPTALGQPTAFTAAVTAGSNVVYAWAFGDGGTGSGRTPMHTYGAAGVYMATVTASNGANALQATTRVTVETPIAGLQAANSSPTPAGQPVAFDATITQGDNVAYTWNFGDGATGSGNPATHVYTEMGFYTAIVTAANQVSQLSATTRVTITEVPLAGLSAANDSPTPLGQPTHLTATLTGGSGASYAWAFGDGTTGSGATIAHTYGAVGSYTAIVTASNNVNSLTTTTAVTISDLLVAGLSAADDSPTALGQPTAFSAAVTAGSNVVYAWVFGDSTTGSGRTPSHTYGAAGIYTATVTASNGANALQATTRVTVETPIAGLHAVNDSPTPAGQPVAFDATITQGDNVAYAWNFGDGATTNGADVNHTYAEMGVYTAIVTATNQVSQLSATTRVTITEVPLAGLVAVNDSPTQLDNATTLTATVTEGSGAVYTWAFGDGATGSGAVVQHVYPAVGTYTAVVTASNSVNSLTANTYVTITAGTPVSGLLAFNDSPTPLGSVTTLSATVESGSGVTYNWAFGDGNFFIPQNWPDSGKVVTHTYPAVGTYTATVTATNRGGQVTATTAVVIVDAPIAGLSASNDSPTGLGRTTTLSATVTSGSNISFTWDLGDGHSASGATVTHTYSDVGVYTATVTATNSINFATATTTVTIVPVQYVFLPLVMRQ